MKKLINHLRLPVLAFLLLFLNPVIAQKKDKKSSAVKATTEKVNTKNQQVAKDLSAKVPAKPIALLIGNNEYAAPNELKTPTNDVRLLRRLLIKKGYSVILSQNGTHKEIKGDINTFITRSKKAPMSFFYYGGHTIQSNNKNYLVPIDAKLLTQEAIITEAIDLDWIIQKLDSTKVNIMTIDGCYPSKFPYNSLKSNTEDCFATPLNLPRRTAVSFTTAQNVSNTRKNSLFSTAFLKESGNIQIYSVFIKTKTAMNRSSKGTQNLIVYGNLNKHINWMGIGMTPNLLLPNFPWPPPKPSAQVASNKFDKAFQDCKTLEDVNKLLSASLHQHGYDDMRYYGIGKNGQNHGFTIVTRLEQINLDATSKEHPNRWNEGLLKDIDNDNDIFLIRVLNSIFFPAKGYFRVFAFLVTDLDIHEQGAEISRKDALAWFNGGIIDELPPQIGNKNVKDYKVRAYIYEFELSENNTEATLLESSKHSHTGIEDILISGLGTKLIKD